MPVLLDSYSESNYDGTIGGIYNASPDGDEIGQTFNAPSTTTLYSVKFYLAKLGSPTGNATAKLYAHTGTFGTSGVPTGAALATSNNLNVASLSTSFAVIELTFPTPPSITSGTKYCVALGYTGGDAGNHVRIGGDASSPSHGGNAILHQSGSWVADSGVDICFYVYEPDAASPIVGKFMTTNTKFF